ncbi:hypothetical protein ACROYT_G005016 [Oculina patagonica]
MAELEQRESQTPIAHEVQNQVTSTTPATKPAAKNQKRVAAGKLAAEKTKQAREAQKKAAIEAAAIIAKQKEKKSASAKRSVTPSPKGSPAPESSAPAPPESSGFTTNQWISLLSVGVAILQLMSNAKTSKAFSRRAVKCKKIARATLCKNLRRRVRFQRCRLRLHRVLQSFKRQSYHQEFRVQKEIQDLTKKNMEKTPHREKKTLQKDEAQQGKERGDAPLRTSEFWFRRVRCCAGKQARRVKKHSHPLKEECAKRERTKDGDAREATGAGRGTHDGTRPAVPRH